MNAEADWRLDISSIQTEDYFPSGLLALSYLLHVLDGERSRHSIVQEVRILYILPLPSPTRPCSCVYTIKMS